MGWPNVLSAIRLFISPVVFALILHGKFTAALVWFLLASLTDFLDGEIARRWQLASDFGEWLDPIADKFLTLFSLSALLMRGYCPAWFVALMVTLSVFQLCGAVLIRTFRPLAEAGINIDMIVQNTSLDGLADISFTLPESDLVRA